MGSSVSSMTDVYAPMVEMLPLIPRVSALSGYHGAKQSFLDRGNPTRSRENPSAGISVARRGGVLFRRKPK